MRRYQIHDDETEINITPMLDVVFILLIFFIVTSSFVRESGVDVHRPDQATTAKPEEPADILIALADNDDITIDGRMVDIRVVRANIERLRVNRPQSAVVLQADPDASNGMVVRIIDQAKRAGVERVSLLSSE